MFDNRIDVLFGAQIGELLAGLTEATAAVKESAEGMGAAFEGLGAAVESALAPVLAITAVLKGGEIFEESIAKTAEFGKQLEIATQKTGMEAEALSALQYAADLSDVSTEQLTTGMQRLARAMEAAAKGQGPANDAFNALGIAALDANDHMRPMHDVLLDIANRFAGMEDGAGKTALAMDIFGRSGASLIPLLNQGAAGISALEATAKQLGVTMGEDGVQKTNAYVDRMKEFHQVNESLERQLALNLMPTLTTLAGWAEKLAEHFNNILTYVKLLNPEFAILQSLWNKLTSGNPGDALLKDDDLVARLGLNAKTPSPTLPSSKDKGPSQIEQWTEELNKRKQLALDNEEDLKQVELDFWKSKLAIATEGSKEYIEIHSRILALEEDQARQAKETQKKVAKETAKEWVDTFNSIPRAFTSATNDIGKSVFSLRDLFREMFGDVVKMSAAAGAAMLRDHIATELAKKEITVQSVLARVAAVSWGALQTVAIETASAVKSIAISSAQMFMGLAAWLSNLFGPYAIPAALGMTAGAIGIGASLMSAAGGFDIPSGLNPMTQLHAQEMVLPAELANKIRGMTGGSGGGGDVYHITAIDAKSFRDFARRNPDAFGDGVAAAITGNHAGLNNALKKRG